MNRLLIRFPIICFPIIASVVFYGSATAQSPGDVEYRVHWASLPANVTMPESIDRPVPKRYAFNLPVLLMMGLMFPSLDTAKTTRSRTYNLPVDGSFLESESVGSNTTVNVLAGGSVGNHFSAGAWGQTSTHLLVNITGGTVGDFFNAYSGSFINISDGTIGDFFFARRGSEVNLTGGEVGNRFCAFNGSKVNISGGRIENSFWALKGSEVTITGGSFEGDFVAKTGSNVNLFGISFAIDGVSIDGLNQGEAYTITQRDARLTGRLADGSSFSFDLNSAFDPDTSDRRGDYCSPLATLRVTPISDVNQEATSVMFPLALFGVVILGGWVARNAIVVWGKPDSSHAFSKKSIAR